MWQTGYPLHVTMVRDPAARRASSPASCTRQPETLSQIEVVDAERAAAGLCRARLEHLIDIGGRRRCDLRSACARACCIRCSAAQNAARTALDAANELNILRSRDPAHGEELIAWTTAS